MNFLNKEEKRVVAKFKRELKESMGSNIVSLQLFGSKTRGDFDSDSDVDILMVVKKKTPRVRNKVFDILFNVDPYYKYKISPVLYSQFEYNKNKAMGSPLFETVEKEGVRL